MSPTSMLTNFFNELACAIVEQLDREDFKSFKGD